MKPRATKQRRKFTGQPKPGAAKRRAEFWSAMYYKKNVMGTQGDPFK